MFPSIFFFSKTRHAIKQRKKSSIQSAITGYNTRSLHHHLLPNQHSSNFFLFLPSTMAAVENSTREFEETETQLQLSEIEKTETRKHCYLFIENIPQIL